MTRAEQERMIGQYLRGEMGAAAEQDFFIQVALDSDLRQTLKAFRVVETAMQKHRDAIPGNRVDAYNRFMAILAPAAPVINQTESPIPFSAQVATVGAIGEGLHFAASKIALWTTVAVAAGSLIVGTFVVAPMLNDSKPESTLKENRFSTPSPAGVTQVPVPKENLFTDQSLLAFNQSAQPNLQERTGDGVTGDVQAARPPATNTEVRQSGTNKGVPSLSLSVPTSTNNRNNGIQTIQDADGGGDASIDHTAASSSVRQPAASEQSSLVHSSDSNTLPTTYSANDVPLQPTSNEWLRSTQDTIELLIQIDDPQNKKKESKKP